MTTSERTIGCEAVRAGAGWRAADDVTVLVVRGPDAASFLQSQTTNDVRALGPGRGQASASLDPKAHLIAPFTLHRRGDEFWILVDPARRGPLAAHLEKHHILEDLEVADGPEFRFLSVQGPRAAEILEAAWPAVAWPVEELAMADFGPGGEGAFAVWRSDTGEDGFLLAARPEASGAVSEALRTTGEPRGLVEIGPEAAETLRIEAGIPRWGADMDEGHVLPATGLERVAVSYSKGCFIGQEVVARVKTYGSISRALVGLVFDGEEVPSPGTPIALAGKDVGEVRSGTWSPGLAAPIALAYLLRDVREAGRTLEFEAAGRSWRARVVVPPFVERADRTRRAAERIEWAQRAFADGREDEAIAALRDAIRLDAKNPDAYESLGVILSRRGEFDEAIVLMQELARVAPENPMAWTNLSLYHMKLGRKEEAEAAQGKAALLSMKAQAAKVKAEKQATARRADLERRLEMFRQVLAIDAEDHLAQFGMGKGLLDLDRPGDALPYLEAAHRIKPDHSVGYVELGRCLERLEETDRAREVYRQGIGVATKRGDLMPLKEMQRRLAALG